MEDPETKELRIDQAEHEREELEHAREADLPTEEHTHVRRADKAAYLREKLADRERSEEENG